jgi:tetratricopeptide (TPR) repeat protein
VTAGNAEAAAALEGAVLGLVSHRADTAGHLERALALDPDLLLGQVIRGFGYKLLGRADLAPHAQAASERAKASWAQRGGTERERLLMRALHAWCDRAPTESLSALEEALRTNPLDRLALKLSHAMYFYSGMSVAMRESLERVLPAWRDAHPAGLGRVLGCYAFALTETGAPEEGERVGREAMSLGEIDPWGMHATLHAIHARGALEDVIAWLDATQVHLEGANNFAGHVHWHHAVVASLLGRWSEALALYDTKIAVYPAHDYRDLINEVTLLHRCQRAGVEIGDRLERCASTARMRLGDHGSAFADVHHVLALSLAGESAAGAAFVASMQAHADATLGVEARVLGEVAVPAAAALLKIKFDPSEAQRALEALREALPRLGGSRAQHTVFELLRDDARQQHLLRSS